MVRSFFKIALRTLSRDPGQTVIHVSGLSIGLAFSTLILPYVRDELSLDRVPAGLIALALALAIVGWHAAKAASRNPVTSLRYE